MQPVFTASRRGDKRLQGTPPESLLLWQSFPSRQGESSVRGSGAGALEAAGTPFKPGQAAKTPTKADTMKPTLSKLQRRLVQSAGLLVLAALLAATVAWSASPKARVQLGGAFICQLDSGMRVAVTYGAVDPSGLKGVWRGQIIPPPAMLATMGVDTLTDLISDEVVTGPNTSESTGIAYGLAGGNIALILMDHSFYTHVSPNEKHNTHQYRLYLASADADNDGFPDAGATPIAIVNNSSIAKRITR